MPGKPLDDANLNKDLSYIIHGTNLHAVYAYACPPKPGLKILEPGCGSGKFGISYALTGGDVTLLDIDPEVIKYAQELNRRAVNATGRSTSISFVTGSLFDLDKLFGQNAFDFVFNEGLVHHWPDPQRQDCLDQMAAVVRHGGVVCTVCSNALCPDMMDYAGRIEHTYMGMPPKQTPLTPEELGERLEKAGLARHSIKLSPVGTEHWNEAVLIAGWGTKP